MFITLADIPQSLDVEVEQSQIDEANAYVSRFLLSKGIDPSQVDTQNPHLKQLAITYALYKAYLLFHRDKESPYLEKAKELEKELQRLESQITSEVLGISSSSGKTFGVFKIQRG